jgi:type IV pilus assembly protein PilW
LSRQPLYRRQLGLTLIELMISIAIGLVVVGAVSYLYVGSKGAYRGNQSLARVQEAGRFALDSIARDVRRSGALGCGSLASPTSGAAVPVNILAPVPLAASAIQGFSVSAATVPPLATPPAGWAVPPGAPAYWGGDVLQLQIATGVPVRMSDIPDTTQGDITIADNSTADFVAGDYALLADCASATVFQVVKTAPAAVAPATLVYYAAGTPVPPLTTGKAAFSLTSFPTLQHFDQVTYYLGLAPGTAGANAMPALYRYSARSGKAEEVVENVEDLDIVYGVDTTGTRTAGVYEHADAVTAAAAWGSVVSVRVSVIGVGDRGQGGVATARQSLLFRGNDPNPAATIAWNAPDTRLRQVFSATAALRDRVP